MLDRSHNRSSFGTHEEKVDKCSQLLELPAMSVVKWLATFWPLAARPSGDARRPQRRSLGKARL